MEMIATEVAMCVRDLLLNWPETTVVVHTSATTRNVNWNGILPQNEDFACGALLEVSDSEKEYHQCRALRKIFKAQLIRGLENGIR
jgi:hypothetical protein